MTKKQKRVTCIAYSNKLNVICLGSKDQRVTVWSNSAKEVWKNPTYILYGHSRTLRSVKILSSLKIVVSADKSGLILIHSIASGEFLSEIKLSLDKEEKVRSLETDQ
jgi:WD40 repeat protein